MGPKQDGQRRTDRRIAETSVIPSHPGRTLSAELSARGLNPHALALKLRVPSTRVADIVNGKRGITVETALRLGRYFGNGADYWMNLQTAYDIGVAEQQHGARIAAEVENGAAGESQSQ